MNAESRQPTDFEMAVYDAVRLVPAGKVTTYGKIAERISRGTARSVGTALAKNPYAPEVPCHRVVRADGSLGGFYGETSGPEIERKEKMLVREQVPFIKQGKVDPVAFY
ncbi:MAG: MGMT family protein [Akkermansiaceae bacterium]|nr:MGMT family protein [Akkermansiaceae bacterium]